MNIKELIEWRHDCFFCHSKLSISLEINGVEDLFWIENDYLIIQSEPINLSIHIETGKLFDLNQSEIMIDEFLQKSHFKIVCKCLYCIEPIHQFYRYSGAISLIPLPYRSINIFHFREVVHNYNLIFVQQKSNNREWGTISCVKNGEKFSVNSYELTIPFLDLKKITPAKLEQKLKTYIVFS